ncbi:MAG: neutral zinc metallopeptidase [Cyanobacteriota bacterium]|jgi:predicted metalloprotease
MTFSFKCLGLLVCVSLAWIFPQTVSSDVVFEPENIKDYFKFVTAIEENLGIQESIVEPYDGSVNTPCGLVTSIAYCPKNLTIYLNTNELTGYLNSYGDNAFYILLSHEWGHHLLNLMNYIGPAIGEELAADCISGYLFSLYNKLNNWAVSEDEIIRIVTMTSAVGDYSGFTASHGVAQQRVSYIYRGLKGAQNSEGLDICLR